MGTGAAKQLAKDTILAPEQAWALVKESSALLLDVRAPKELETVGRFEDSINIPHTDISSRYTELEEYRTKPIVAFCAVGGRSALAKQELEQLGFEQVFNGGGFKDLQAGKG